MTDPIKKFYSVAEIREMFGVSANTVYKWLMNGRFKGAIRPGGDRGQWRVPAASVDAIHDELMREF